MGASSTVLRTILITATFLYASAQNPAWQDAYNFYWYQNCDFFGRDIRVVENTAWSSCGAYCKNDPDCSFFTWTIGLCYLKKDFPRTAVEIKNRYLCGFVKSSTDVTPTFVFWNDAYYLYWAKGADFVGDDIAFQSASSKEECAEQCMRDSLCHFFTYNYSLKRCWRKNILNFNKNFKPSTVVPNTEAITGFFKPNITRPFNPAVFWYDSELGYWGNDCAFPGSVIKSVDRIRFDECQRECAFTNTCRAFSWIGDRVGTCDLVDDSSFTPLTVRSRRGYKCGFSKPSSGFP